MIINTLSPLLLGLLLGLGGGSSIPADLGLIDNISSAPVAESSQTQEAPAQTEEPQPLIGLPAPQIKNWDELQDATVTLKPGENLVISGEKITGTVEDEEVASFNPAYTDGSAQFNPSITAHKAGDTTATLTNGDGESTTVTIHVGE